jgi:cytochrome bd-type quinol oxidase subunit 1
MVALIGKLILVPVLVIVTAVVAYLFLKHNPAKKAAIDAAEQKAADAVNKTINKL